MEKRIIGFFLRTCVVLMACGYAAITANANVLTNGGFELGSGLYTNTAPPNQVTTAAVAWVQFNDCFRVASSDIFPNTNGCDVECVNPAANTNAVFPGALTGDYTMRIASPGGWNGAGAYQEITNGVSAGQTWVLSGNALNWSGDPMTNLVPAAQQFGLIQLVFKGQSSNTLATLDGPQLTPAIITTDTWTSCSVTGMTPVGTVRVWAYVLHVGFGAGAVGSLFWDDLALAAPSIPLIVKTNAANIVAGNQVCWPTGAGLSYQPQYTNSATGPVWTNLGGEIPGDGNTNCVFDASKQKFYRVIELQ